MRAPCRQSRYRTWRLIGGGQPGSGPCTVIGIAARAWLANPRKIDIADGRPRESILVHNVGEQMVSAGLERREADGELATGATFRMQVPHSIQLRHAHQK